MKKLLLAGTFALGASQGMAQDDQQTRPATASEMAQANCEVAARVSRLLEADEHPFELLDCYNASVTVRTCDEVRGIIDAADSVLSHSGITPRDPKAVKQYISDLDGRYNHNCVAGFS